MSKETEYNNPTSKILAVIFIIIVWLIINSIGNHIWRLQDSNRLTASPTKETLIFLAEIVLFILAIYITIQIWKTTKGKSKKDKSK